jgi:SOS-response transcriptional repressor LexA
MGRIARTKPLPSNPIAARIASAFDASGMSQVQFAKAAAVSDATVNKWLSDQREPSATSIARIAHALNLTTEFLLTGKERTPVPTVIDKDARPVPLVGAAAAGEPLMKIRELKDVEWTHFGATLLRRIYGSMPDSERAVMLEIEGDSMEPDLVNGGLVLLDRGPRGRGISIEELKPDAVYAVRFPDSDGVTLKKVSRTDDSLVIEARNPDRKRHPTKIIRMEDREVPRVVLGRVVWKMGPV